MREPLKLGPAGTLRIVASLAAYSTLAVLGSALFSRAVRFSALRIYSVRDYGAKGDGVTDDTAAGQAAIDACATTGGIVFFDRGVYLVSQAGASNGVAWALAIYKDNIQVVGAGPKATRIRTTSSSASMSVFFVCGSAKPEGPAQWLKYAPWRFAGDTFAGGGAIAPVCPFPAHTINAASRAAASVTCTTAADAGNYAAGDYVVTRTGQLVVNGSNWNAEPDAEINRVVSANPGTGAIQLERPLSRPYAQEYQSAIGQISSTTVAAVLTPLTIMKVTSATIENIVLSDLALENLTGTAAVVNVLGTVSGYREENLLVESLGAAQAGQQYRDVVFKRKTAIMSGTHRSDMWPLTTATMTTDVEINDVTAIATQKIATLHIHEGSARVKARGVRLFSGDNSIAGVYPVSVRARVYDFSLDDYVINGGGVSAAIFIGSTETGGGRIGKGTARGAWARTIICGSPNWDLTPPDDAKGGDIQLDPAVRATGVALPVRVLSAWLDDTTTLVTLGTQPAQSIIVDVGCYVYEVFNSSGTDLVDIGTGGDSSIVAGIDVSTAFNKNLVKGAAWGYRDTALPITAKYTAGGTAATTGKVLVWVVIASVPTHVA